MNDKQVLQDVAFNPAAKCSPTATQCPRCNNPHNACDKDAQPAGKDAWLRQIQVHLADIIRNHNFAITAGYDPIKHKQLADDAEAKLWEHLRSHTAAAPNGFVLVPVEPTHEIISAMLCSKARDDEGEFPLLMDLIDFSGENKNHAVMRAAYASMIAAAGKE